MTRNHKKRKPMTANKSTQTSYQLPDTGRSSRTPDIRRPERPPDTVETRARTTERHKSVPIECQGCPASTMIPCRSRRQTLPTSPLFKDDLIDIIAEKNDKQLKLLFRSPTRGETNSVMNLTLTPAKSRKRVPCTGELRPWK